MSLKDAIIRHVAAEPDLGRRYRLAAAMLAGKDTEDLGEVYFHAINTHHGTTAPPTERDAARAVIDTLGACLLARVGVLDEALDRLLDRLDAAEVGDDEDELIVYDPEEGLSVFLDPDPEDVEGDADLALDAWAEPGTVWLSMRVVKEGAARLTGSLTPEDARYLIRGLEIAAADAEDEDEDADGDLVGGEGDGH
jgi:hypothetical protein